jgi:tetratricopeptide (TPR) repeat protein
MAAADLSRPNAPAAAASPRHLVTLQVALIIAAGCFVYWPALRGEFLWDDRIDIVENELLRSADGLGKIWSEPSRLFDFYPLKHTVQWVQWQLWGPHTLGYHATNLALHLLGALLFWRVLRQLGLRNGWIGALLFTVHPLAVESVAWIAELKNTLSLPPLLLSFSAFITFAELGRRNDHVRACAWFLVSMLCKTSAVTFPVFLALYLWWRHRRLTLRDGVTLAPFFAISLVLGLVTVWFQVHRAIGDGTFEVGGIAARAALVGTALSFYFWKCVWPAGLLPMYPRWSIDPPAWWQFLPLLVLGAGLTWLWRSRTEWSRHVLLGVGWFGLFLAPFVGVVTISFMHYTWVMDHFAYVSLLAVIGLAVAWFETATMRKLAAPVLVAVSLLLAGLAREHAKAFRDEETLWAHTVARNPGAWSAHYNLGVKQAERGDTTAARRSYETAVRLAPEYAPAHNNLGKLLAEAGQFEDAHREFETALRNNPNLADTHNNLGKLLHERGNFPDAIRHLNTALQLAPTNHSAWNNLGLALDATGQPESAARAFAESLRLKPDFFDAHNNYGSLLRRLERYAEAEAHFRAALRAKPRSPEVHFNLGNLQRKRGQLAESIASYEQALRLKPDFGFAHHNLALSLHDAGRDAEARAHYAEARRLDPTLPAWPY